MAQKCPSDATISAQLKKTEPKSQVCKKSGKSSKNHLHGRNERKTKAKPRKSQDLSTRKDFVTIDIDTHRLTAREQKKRLDDRKSKNQVLGQLEAYNQTMPSHFRIAPEVTGQLLKERVRANANIFEFDTAMARSDLILKEARVLLNNAPSRKPSTVKFTEASTSDSSAPDVYSLRKPERPSKSEEELPDKIEERFAKWLKLKPKRKKEICSPRHQRALDGSILVPESHHQIFPILPQEHLTSLRETYPVCDTEKARAAWSYHRGTLCSPSQSHPYLDPYPTEYRTLCGDSTPSDMDRLLLYSTLKDLKQLTDLEKHVMNSASVYHETDLDPDLAGTRARTINHVHELRGALFQLRNEIEDREYSRAYKIDYSMTRNSTDNLDKLSLGTNMGRKNVNHEINDIENFRESTSSLYLDSKRKEGNETLSGSTESEELILNLKTAIERSAEKPTHRHLKNLSASKQLIVLKPAGYAHEFPKDSSMDLSQVFTPLVYNKWGRVKTISSPWVRTNSASNDREPEVSVPMAQSEHSWARMKIKEHLKRLGKYER